MLKAGVNRQVASWVEYCPWSNHFSPQTLRNAHEAAVLGAVVGRWRENKKIHKSRAHAAQTESVY